MGKQIINRLKKTLAVLLATCFVLSVTSIAVNAKFDQNRYPNQGDQNNYRKGYEIGQKQGYSDGYHAGFNLGTKDAKSGLRYKEPSEGPTVNPYNTTPYYIGIADGYRDAYLETFKRKYYDGYYSVKGHGPVITGYTDWS